MSSTQKNKNQIVLVSAVVLLVMAIAAFVFFNKGLSWAETFEPDDNNPYGAQVLYELLKTSRSDQEFIKVSDSIFKDLPIDPTDKVDSYLFIGSDLFADSTDVERIMKFVEAGNSAFIVTATPYHLIADSLLRSKYTPHEEFDAPEEVPIYSDDEVTEYDEEPEDYYNEYAIQEIEKKKISDYYSDTVAPIHLKSFNESKSYLGLVKKYRDKKRLTDWYYFQKDITNYSGESVEHLGALNKTYSNYIRFQFGKGYFYLHTTPLVFSNFYMINDTSMNYCRDALSYLGDGSIYWDEENRTYDYKAVNHHSNSESPSKPNEGPLEFILSEPGLRMAWYLILSGTVFYLMFGAKRKQRIVEPMENMENTSIEYAEVISQMFMKQKDHKKLVLMKMDLFKSFLRDRFRIKLPSDFHDENEVLFKEIAQKSNIREESVKDIFDQYKYLSTIMQVETTEMLAFHHKLENFYNNCK